jgi:hypothetical protein
MSEPLLLKDLFRFHNDDYLSRLIVAVAHAARSVEPYEVFNMDSDWFVIERWVGLPEMWKGIEVVKGHAAAYSRCDYLNHTFGSAAQ